MNNKSYRKNSFKALIIGILFIVFGITLCIVRNVNIGIVKNEVIDEFKNYTEDDSRVTFNYKNNDGETQAITFDYYTYKNYPDEFYKDVKYAVDFMNGDKWCYNMKKGEIASFVIGIISLFIFVVLFMKYKGKQELIDIVKMPIIGIGVAILFEIIAIDEMLTSEEVAERSMHSGQGDPRFTGTLFFICLTGVIVWLVYLIYKRYERYKLKINNPEEYKALIKKERAEEQQRQVIHELMLEKERQDAIESQNGGPAWRIRYMTDPCPYCGHYKVRYAKWEDKRMSVAFWGMASSKISKDFKCENCKKMW